MYDPNEVGKKNFLFGLPYSIEESNLIILPVHMDVTVSYGQGTSKSPDLIIDVSSQLDLSLSSVKRPWKLKMASYNRIIPANQHKIQRERAINVIKALESGKDVQQNLLQHVNSFCESIHTKIEDKATKLLESGKIVCLMGGDHSSPLGLIRALAKKGRFGILQIDAHMDLRNAYAGFIFSHASIMYNAMKEEGVTSLTQVGIRDFCENEESYIYTSKKPIYTFYDETIFQNSIQGVSWKTQVEHILDTLPSKVYISFDVDGMDPTLCPHTGTPVVGGLQFNPVAYLIEQVVKSGRSIIGFDVCETGNNAWDANVAARMIYRLAVLTGVSNHLLSFK